MRLQKETSLPGLCFPAQKGLEWSTAYVVQYGEPLPFFSNKLEDLPFQYGNPKMKLKNMLRAVVDEVLPPRTWHSYPHPYCTICPPSLFWSQLGCLSQFVSLQDSPTDTLLSRMQRYPNDEPYLLSKGLPNRDGERCRHSVRRKGPKYLKGKSSRNSVGAEGLLEAEEKEVKGQVMSPQVRVDCYSSMAASL